MKTKRMMGMMVAVAAACVFSAVADAMSLESLEKGAAVIASFSGGDVEAMGEDDMAMASEAVTFVEDFYQWLPALGAMVEKDAGKPVKKGGKLPVEPSMRTPKYFTAGIVKFIAKHKPEGANLKSVPAAPVVLAWYISQHPAAGSDEKAAMDSLLIETFGEKYRGRAEVVAEIEAARRKESGKTGE